MSDVKVYVVDDEMLTREGLAKYINWKELGCTLVGKGGCGLDVLEFLQSNTIDLLITDIRMPNMDGMELIEAISHQYKNISVIILTAHSEFTYAQQAVKYKFVKDFILKPIELIHLNESIKKEVETIKNNGEQAYVVRLDDQEVKEYNSSYYSAIKKSLITDFNNNDFENITDYIFKISKEIEERGFSINIFKRFCIDIVGKLRDAISDMNINARLSRSGEDVVYKIISISDFATLNAYMAIILGDLIDYIVLYRKNQISPLVLEAIGILEKNFRTPKYNLQYVSELMNISSNYLSTRFKGEVGVSFIKYLNSLKIEYAREMLSDRRYKIYEVATSVGISDVRYFIKLFKEYTGQTPSECRKNLGISQED